MSLRKKLTYASKVLPGASWRALATAPRGSMHLMIALADHFEPAIDPESGRTRVPRPEQERRLEWWSREYPKVVDPWRDHDGRPLMHTYFYPAEQYDAGLLEMLADHCHQGWGEIEIHLHHGWDQPDTAENTHRVVTEFRDRLAFRHRCLSFESGSSQPCYSFVHGDFALANSSGGHACGVDSEMKILAETGCYADFTLPTGPLHPAQTAKINSVYECALPLEHAAPHRRGTDLEVGRVPQIFPLIVQGPLVTNFAGSFQSKKLLLETGAITGPNPPSLHRLSLWKQARVQVHGRPDWLFLKLHCHSMDPTQKNAVIGASFRKFLQELVAGARERKETLHFVTAREMTNIILAACEGREGSPGQYREHRFKRALDVPGAQGQRTSTPVGVKG